MSTSLVQPDEEQLRRNLAITLGTQPPMIPRQTQGPQIAGPGNVMLPGEQPVDLSIKSPVVTGPFGQQTGPVPQRGTLAGETNERARLLSTGSGISQIPKRIEATKFGEAHPTLAKIAGTGLEGLATLGDIGLSLTGPGRIVAERIPGTEEHHALLLRNANKQVGEEQTEQQKEAQTALESAQRAQIPITAQREATQLAGTLAAQGEKAGPGGTILPQTPEEQTPAFKLEEQLKQAQIRGLENPWLKEAGNQPLGNVDQINRGLTDRYQVMHPNEALPKEFTLGQDATKNDFDRVDKLLAAQETAEGNKQNHADSERLREATLALATAREQNTEETQGSKWVTWTDANGRMMAGPLSEAKRNGVTDYAQLQGQEIRDVQNARHVVELLDKQGDPKRPETQGVLQLIDSLDRDGKLGVLASRYNRFVTTGVGASPNDDPRIITLIDKNMLADTGTMLAHFGASGGRSPAMLQHFLNLSNSGTMDGVTLRAGTKAIEDYMRDRAMLPEGGAQAGTQKFTDNGVVYNIPSDQVNAFKKDHPNAR